MLYKQPVNDVQLNRGLIPPPPPTKVKCMVNEIAAEELDTPNIECMNANTIYYSATCMVYAFHYMFPDAQVKFI